MRRLLFLTPVEPDPNGIGLNARAHAWLVALAEDYLVDVFVLPRSGGETAPRRASIELTTNDHRRIQKRLARTHPFIFQTLWQRPATLLSINRPRLRLLRHAIAGRQYSVILVFRLDLAPFAFAAASRAASPKPELWLDQDDIESKTLRRILALDPARPSGLAPSSLEAAWQRFERRWIPRFRQVFVCSQIDKTELLSLYPSQPVRIFPNIPPAAPDSVLVAAPPSQTFRLLFIGSLGYAPNKDAVHWLLDEIHPLVRDSWHVDLHIAGRGTPDDLRTKLAASPQVNFWGEIPDVSPVFQQAHALVVPLRAGGGTRIKILQAFAYGRPVICTSLGIEGIEANPEKHYLLAESAADFASQIQRLITDPTLAPRLVQAGRNLVEQRYTIAHLRARLPPVATPRPPTTWIADTGNEGVVSVIMATFNRPQLVLRAVASLAAQSWPDIEVIIVDDGSSPAVQTTVFDHWRPRLKITVVTQANSGVAAARNRGTIESSGAYLLYLDDDDELHSDAIESLVRPLREGSEDIVVGRIHIRDERGEISVHGGTQAVRSGNADSWLYDMWLLHAACYRRRIIADAGPWNVSLRQGEDYEFIWRAKAVSLRPPLFLSKIVGIYHLHCGPQIHSPMGTAENYLVEYRALRALHVWLRNEGRSTPARHGAMARRLQFLGTLRFRLNATHGQRALFFHAWCLQFTRPWNRRWWICLAGWLIPPTWLLLLWRRRHAP